MAWPTSRPCGRRCRAQDRTGAAARRCPRGDLMATANLETDAVIRDEIEALVARERPGWRVVEVVEINDESGPSFEVTVERGHERRTVLVSTDERIVGERR
jgi:hypothetical protein